MKREKLKFVLTEVALGSQLVIPRRLRLLHWPDIGYPTESIGVDINSNDP